MRRILDNDIFTLISRLLIGGLFIYASFYKVVEPAEFAKSIWFYHMVPGSLINLMAIILPWVELICGIFLIIGFQYRGAVLLVNFMMLIFLAALSSAVIRGISIDCGCFKASAAGANSAWETIFRDLFFMIFTIQMFISRSKKWLLDK